VSARYATHPDISGLRHLPHAADDGLVRFPSRPFPLLVDLRSLATRRLTATLLVAALAALVFAAVPAGAVVTEVAGTKVGLQKHNGTSLFEAGDEPENFGNPNGNPVVHANVTYAIYWDPKNRYHGDWQHLINTFLGSVGTASGSLASVFAVDTQYTDKTNRPAVYRSTFRGAYTDTTSYPAAGCTDPNPMAPGDAVTCITDKQIREQLESFISTHGLQRGTSSIFYLLTPPGVTVCVDAGGTASHCSSNSASANSFCSYHSDINPGGLSTGDANTILYATIPWIAGGFGDPLLLETDRTLAFDCQDGGFDPSSTPIEEKEHVKARTPKEEEEFHEKTAKEQREAEEARELGFEAPHQQEPNQTSCPNVTDGGCDTGLADIIINQIGTEQQNIVTNPLLNAWQDPANHEATDECRNVFALVLGGSVVASKESGAGTLFNQSLGGGRYYLNDAFNLAAFKLEYPAAPCLTHVNLAPSFTAPNPVNAGDIVGFDGMESNLTLGAGTHFPASGPPQTTYATYTWDFGDGTPTVTGFAPGAPSVNSPATSPCAAPWLTPCAASAFHSYQYGGTYSVTLTVTDTGGNTASVTEPITVDGPPPPLPGSGTGASTGAGSSSGAGASSTPGATTKPPVPGPVATQAVLSSSLSRTLRKGLVVRYSVSQQATGHFEVLLAASIAHRLGLHPPLATGLPAGTSPQVVIAKALLVTTKAGRNTLKLQFGKITARRLRRLHKVPLMLRLTVRNAGGGTTTVLSQLTLH